jgi:flagellar biosynthesis protein
MDTEKIGVAVGYSGNKSAPEILSKARGALVEKLLRIARENNITIYRDSDLAEALSALDTGTQIPETLYRAMAEVLAYCYTINDKFRQKISAGY